MSPRTTTAHGAADPASRGLAPVAGENGPDTAGAGTADGRHPEGEHAAASAVRPTPAPALDRETARVLERDVLAKMFSEFSHERLLRPEPSGAGWTVADGTGAPCWYFEATRHPLEHWEVDPASVRRVTPGSAGREPDAQCAVRALIEPGRLRVVQRTCRVPATRHPAARASPNRTPSGRCRRLHPAKDVSVTLSLCCAQELPVSK